MEMGELGAKNNNNNNNNSRVGGVGVGVGCRPHTTEKTTTTAATTTAAQSTDFVLQWGNRKRLRCMKIQVKNNSTSSDRTTRVRVDRGVVLRSNNNNNNRDSCSNLRRHFSSPPPPPSIPIPHRISPSSRNCEGSSGAMKGQSNGVAITSCSAEEKAQDNKRNNVNGGSASSETAQDSKKGGGSSSGSDAIAVWLPKFVISLTNKEKEEDFMAIKGSKLPQRPKKRAKFIQRTLNFVSPGSLLCDLTLERYEVREKKISKKRPRGLKAMGNMESDSE